MGRARRRAVDRPLFDEPERDHVQLCGGQPGGVSPAKWPDRSRSAGGNRPDAHFGTQPGRLRRCQPINYLDPDYSTPVEKPAFTSNTHSTLDQTGFYLQDQLEWNNWIVNLAGRYDAAKTKSTDLLTDSRSERNDYATTGRAGCSTTSTTDWRRISAIRRRSCRAAISISTATPYAHRR